MLNEEIALVQISNAKDDSSLLEYQIVLVKGYSVPSSSVVKLDDNIISIQMDLFLLLLEKRVG